MNFHGRHRAQKAVTSLVVVCLSTSVSLGALTETRSYSGWGNNPFHPEWGAAGQPLQRLLPANYPDGVGDIVRTTPNARDISNRIAQQEVVVPDPRGLSGFAWQWGQFLDHDISLTRSDELHGVISIPVTDAADPLHPVIPMHRSISLSPTQTASGWREHPNEISSYIDASNVYGSDPETVGKLRAYTDGQLLTSQFDLMPHDAQGAFIGGDVRANEQVGLMSMHTLFVREHNRLAREISSRATDLPDDVAARDEAIFQRARKLVGAEMQAITYNEFLPALLGDRAPDMSQAAYDATVDATIVNEFAHGLYRFGHSMLPASLKLMDDAGELMEDVVLRDAFFQPTMMTDQPTRLEWILKGLASQPSSRVDVQISEEVRSFLMLEGVPGGLDLAALNIQRGRDHGLTDYNSARVAYGLSPVTGFDQITADGDLQAALASFYDSVDQIDLFVGALAEDHEAAQSLGPLISAALIDQFTRLRDGDRLFYLFDPDMATLQSDSGLDLANWTLSDIIRANTSLEHLQGNVFFVPEPNSLVLFLVAAWGVVLPLRRGRGRR